MRIEIDRAVANDPEAHNWLDRILAKIDDGWHIWDTTSHSDPRAFEYTAWVEGTGRAEIRVRELHIASVQRNAWQDFELHNRYVRVTANPAEPNELTPENAVRLAEKPLCILVENRESDGGFVKRIIKELNKALWAYIEQPGQPVDFDSLGGIGQMPGAVQDRCEEIPFRPRLVVIADSDRQKPGGDESKAAQILRASCEHFGVPCWILAKRASENYLPRSLLSAWNRTNYRHSKPVDAWDQLTDDQKDYYNMKSGWPEKQCEPSDDLFANLLPADYQKLFNGFGKKVHQCWQQTADDVFRQLQERSRGDLEHGICLILKEV
ncbi:MAG: hypothetical protein OXU68_01980 [Bacteroidota bacterium]|nr:hypothetical protein [Bacteroidota bacterium]